MSIDNFKVHELNNKQMNKIKGGFWKIIVEGAIYDTFKWAFSDMQAHGEWVSGGQFRGGAK